MPAFEQSGSRFIVAGTCTFLLIVAVTGAFNFRTDPYGVFCEHRAPIAQTTRTYYDAYSERLWQLRSMARQAAESRQNIILIGASQLIYGIDSCAVPSINKLAMYSLGDGEARVVIESAAAEQEQPMIYLIGTGRTGNSVHLPDPRSLASIFHNLFSWQVTRISVASYASRFHPHPNCAVQDDPPREDMSEAGVTQRISRAITAGYSAAELAGSLDAIGASCSRWSNRVVVFTLPIFFRRENVDSLQALEADRAAEIFPVVQSFNRQYPKCHADFADEASSYTEAHIHEGASESEWIDDTHFKPLLGGRILDSILNRSR